MYALILAGGGGTRLWPVSRSQNPKQFQPFFGRHTLLQKTYLRAKKGFSIQKIFISTNLKQQRLIQKQLPNFPLKNFILEPEKRDTGPALGLAAAFLHKLDPKSIFFTANVDHYVEKEREFHRAIKLAENIVQQHPKAVALLGVNPSYPETGYGYIKMGKPAFRIDGHEVFQVEKFVEKPDLATAKEYLKSWEYLWNPAIFVWHSATLLDLFKKHLPGHYRVLMRIQQALFTPKQTQVIRKEYPKMRPISIDYGIIEKTKNMLVLPVDLGWADIGHWRTVRDVLQKKPGQNVIRGRHFGSAENSLIYGYTKRAITTSGVKDLIIVDTEDALLVCPAGSAQDVKKIVEELKAKKLKKLL
ncbi:mannose-1-phosphate guanylyltransferase [Candidatus Parcubacteria bacterium]|jgi:mannose-1-phosphate guanylyltransferase|nr:MAG: mannose-1-phosphate guanylyltransferase [Candidatus Parcubacteria bacterium]